MLPPATGLCTLLCFLLNSFPSHLVWINSCLFFSSQLMCYFLRDFFADSCQIPYFMVTWPNKLGTYPSYHFASLWVIIQISVCPSSLEAPWQPGLGIFMLPMVFLATRIVCIQQYLPDKWKMDHILSLLYETPWIPFSLGGGSLIFLTLNYIRSNKWLGHLSNSGSWELGGKILGGLFILKFHLRHPNQNTWHTLLFCDILL